MNSHNSFDDILIEQYKPEYRDYFKRLNIEWLEKYFHVEPHDLEVLGNPEGNIIKPGGEIFFAKLNGSVVGTCALAKLDDETFELAKMAVTASAHGLGLGKRLAIAVVEHARKCGGKSVVLESNTTLIPAISLYKSLGFVEEPRSQPSIYERSDIFMRLGLDRLA